MIIITLLFDYDHHWNHSFPFHYQFQYHLKHQWASSYFCSTMIITGIILFHFITISTIISNINDHEDTFVRLWSSLESFFSISLSPPTSSQTSMIISTLLFDYDQHWNHSFLFHYHLQHHLKHQWSWRHFCSTMIITGIILFHFIITSNIISNINDHQYIFVRLWCSLDSSYSISLSPPISSQTSMIMTTPLFDYHHHWNHSFPFHYHFQHHLKYQWSSSHFVRLWSLLELLFSILLSPPTSSQTSMIISTLLFDYDHHWTHSFPFHYQFQHNLNHQ